eukprot:361934_1
MSLHVMQIVLVTCYGFGFVLCILLILSVIHYIWILQHNPRALHLVKIRRYSLYSLFLFSITCLIRTIEQTIFYYALPIDNIWHGICESSSILFYLFAQCFSYLLFIQRFKVIFNQTKYQFSNHIFNILYGLIFLFSTSLFVNMIISQLYY